MRAVGCIRVHLEAHRVHSGSLVHLGASRRSLVSFRFIGFIWPRRGGHLGSLDSFRSTLLVVGFLQVRWVHSGAWSGSFGFVGFIR